MLDISIFINYYLLVRFSYITIIKIHPREISSDCFMQEKASGIVNLHSVDINYTEFPEL